MARSKKGSVSRVGNFGRKAQAETVDDDTGDTTISDPNVTTDASSDMPHDSSSVPYDLDVEEIAGFLIRSKPLNNHYQHLPEWKTKPEAFKQGGWNRDLIKQLIERMIASGLLVEDVTQVDAARESMMEVVVNKYYKKRPKTHRDIYVPDDVTEASIIPWNVRMFPMPEPKPTKVKATSKK